MILSKFLDTEKLHVCEICKKNIDDIHVAACCCLCGFRAHKKCNRRHLINYVPADSKNQYPICINCKENTLPFQKQNKDLTEEVNNDKNDLKIYFNAINNSNVENVINTDEDETAPLNCKYVDYDNFNHAENEKNLSFFHMNISSLGKHKEELETALNILNYKFDIIALTETMLRMNNNPNFDISMPGYKCYNTPTESSKGGSILYIQNKYNSMPRNDLDQLMYKSKDLESTFIEIINPCMKNIIVGCVYRHPSMDLNEFNDIYLNNLLHKISTENKKVFLLGDFNADLMNLETNSSISNFLEIFTTHLYVPHVIFPTRVIKNKRHDFTTKTLIDNIFSNSLNYKDGISGNITLSISDHLAQFLIIPVESKTYNRQFDKYKRDTKHFDREQFTLDMLEVDWKVILKTEYNDPNFSFNEFEANLNSIIDKYMPLKKLTNKEIKQHNKPWITNGLRNSVRRRDSLHKKYIKAKNNVMKSDYHVKYKELRNQIVSLCRISKKNYYQNYFSKYTNNLKETWKGIKKLINLDKKNNITPTSLMVDNKMISNQKEVANEFNNYFSTIASKLRGKINKKNHSFTSYLHNRNDNTFVLHPIAKEEVINVIDKLDSAKGTGPHSIPTDILKFIKFIISESLSDIINLSFKTGIYIENLKVSKIIPIYKGKGSNLSCSNYRPISLLSNIDKIVEKLMFKRLYSFLSKYKVIYNLQFGFRENHSTTHALTYLTEQVRNALDNSNYSCGVFVDLQKAFDTVDHKILLHKLNHYGVRGIENNWFKSYLLGRKQSVFINGAYSNEIIVKHGVPQGSVLGPLLFILYINDLNKALKYSQTIHFADDTSLILENNSLKQMKKYLNFDLKNLSNWLDANKISLNTSKTELLLFRHPNKNINYNLKAKLNGKLLRQSKYVKYLGLYIDHHLNWNHNTNILSSRLSRSIGMLSKIRHYVNGDTLRAIYFSIFSSHLNYGSLVWAQNENNTNVKRISRLQNRAVRIINFSGHRDHAKPIYKKLNILNISDSIEMQNILFVYDSLNSRLPAILNRNFTFVHNTHNYVTRNSLKLKLALPKVNTKVYGQNGIKYKSIKTWNNITDKIQIHSLHELSRSKVIRKVSAFLFSRYL